MTGRFGREVQTKGRLSERKFVHRALQQILAKLPLGVKRRKVDLQFGGRDNRKSPLAWCRNGACNERSEKQFKSSPS